ncbi:MAG TPA: thiamine phosphate synthase [Pyrinomonadaceae bacterium]|nr:thiamine phosphate synthase [Pyrinomonadaceae bacterium]
MLLNLSKPILYLITRGATTEATTAAAPEFTQILNQISAAVAAGIDLIQIREKQLTARVLFELVSESRKLTRGSQTRLLVNDRADIAVGASADGVHLTTQSLDAATIRKTFGEQLLIGASTHSLDEVEAARDSGADFAVFGPVFETESKIGFGSPKGLEELSQVVRAVRGFPVLALGGVSGLNAADCLAAGALGVAGIRLFDDPKDFISLLTALRHSGTNQTI